MSPLPDGQPPIAAELHIVIAEALLLGSMSQAEPKELITLTRSCANSLLAIAKILSADQPQPPTGDL